MSKSLFTLILLMGYSLYSIAQTVNIFVSTPVANYPDATALNSTYTNVGFSTVNITSGTVDANLTTSNYNVAYITEFYDFGAPGPLFINNTQRQQVETFIQNGGHVVWIAESIDDYIFNPGTPPVNANAITTINNIYGTNLVYGTYYNNSGIGPPNLPRIHPSAGPGGLSQQTSVIGSGSYATLLNVPNESKVYTSESFDNTNFFDACTHTTMALFPPYPNSTTGTVLISTELGAPFHGSPSGPFGTGPPVFNTTLDNGIANLHFRLITGASMATINNWSAQASNTNVNCPPQTILSVNDLLAFNAVLLKNESVAIDWKVEENTVAEEFVIERSPNGIVWTTLQTLPYVFGKNSYQTIDPYPHKGMNYYRLQYKDNNNEPNYSATKVVELSKNDLAIRVFPNPTSGKVILEQEVDMTVEDWQLMDALGRIVPLMYQQETTNRVTVDLSQLNQGVYFLKTRYRIYKIHKI